MTRPKEPIADETLMALADGELNDAEAADLRARLARDPELALRFALFAETGALTAGAPAAGSSPVPERLVAAVLKADAEANELRGDEAPAQRRFAVIEGMKPAAAAEAPIRALARAVPGRGRLSARHALPLAASLALVVGAAAGWIAGRGGGDPQAAASGIIGMPVANTAVAAALERLPSGETAAWADPASGRRGTVAMVSSHRVDDGLCREYDVRVEGPSPASATGVSCRRNGAWRTELAVARAAAAGGFAPASGGNAVAEQFLADIGSAGALSAADERKLLGR